MLVRIRNPLICHKPLEGWPAGAAAILLAEVALLHQGSSVEQGISGETFKSDTNLSRCLNPLSGGVLPCF